MNALELPWPPRCLSPNSRTDRRAATSERQSYLRACWAVAKAERFPAVEHMDITFHPPDARKRDLDNMLASIKSGIDGLALAMGINDSSILAITLRKGEPHKPGGKVVVRPSLETAIIEHRGTVS